MGVCRQWTTLLTNTAVALPACLPACVHVCVCLLCIQALLYAVTLTQYDLGAPVTPLPRENPPSIIPFCLTLFNFGTLDDFSNFVNNRGDNTMVRRHSGMLLPTFVRLAGQKQPDRSPLCEGA